MGRKTRLPSNATADRKPAAVVHDNFGGGTIRNDNPRNIRALADAFNVVVYPRHITARTGCRKKTSLLPPALPGTVDFVASKSGDIVTATTAVFDESHVGCFVAWPGTPERHYEITAYLNPAQVRVDSITSEPSTTGAYLHGALNVFHQHEPTRLWVRQWGNELWVYDTDFSSRTRVLMLSAEAPANVHSVAADLDERSVLIFNSNGTFRVDLKTDPYTAWKTNTSVPTERIAEIAETPSALYQYRMLYSMSRLSGENTVRSRLEPLRIEQQSGPNEVSLTQHDYSEVWSEEPAGPGTDTYQVLVCGDLVAPYDTAAGWLAIAPNFGTFFVDCHGLGAQEITVDLSLVSTMQKVAESIQASMNDYFPGTTVRYVVDGTVGHFEIAARRLPNQTITVATEGAVGTPIAQYMQARAADGAVVEDRPVDTPLAVGTLYVPRTATGALDRHWTHYTVWRTMDLRQQYKQGIKPGAYNDPDRYIWDKDLRVAAAFSAERIDGVVTTSDGFFEAEDVGSVLEWDNGDRDTIVTYVNERVVEVYTDPYYGLDDYTGVCAIGNGRVMSASQAGYAVTRTSGGTFTSTDVGKRLFWSNGHSIISAYVSADVVLVHDYTTRSATGATIDPTSRNYCICTPDPTLRARIASLLLPNRFHSAMPNCNAGAVAPGYCLTARRGSGKLYYCQLPDGLNYLVGYHNPGYQINTSCTDDIQAILVTNAVFALLCSNRTWGGSTNNAEFLTVPDVGEAVAVLGGIDIVDGNIGVFDWGSIRAIAQGMWMLITSEPGGRGLRKFNGQQYGSNEAVDEENRMNKWGEDLRLLQQATASVYSGQTGYVFWGKR